MVPAGPGKPDDVVEDFRTFVLARPWENHEVLRADWHFKPQVESVRPDGVNYSRIYDLRELSTLHSDVRGHLERLGLRTELYTPRANQAPLPLTREVFPPEVSAVIEDSYRRDFEAFGEDWSPERLKYDPDGWSADAIAHVAYHTVANERIGDLRAEARRLQRRLDRALAANERLRDARPQAAAPSLTRRVIRRLRG